MDSPKTTFRRLVILLSSILLAGCVLNTADKYYGSGPLTLSPKAQAAYNVYLTKTEPIAFAVTTDGRGVSYFFCKEYQCIPDNGPRRAVESCEETYDRPCKLYADGRKVVWRFSSPAQSPVQQARSDPPNTAPKFEPQSRTTDSITVYNDCFAKFTASEPKDRKRKCICFTDKVMEEFSESTRSRIIGAIRSSRMWSIGDDDNDKVKACFS